MPRPARCDQERPKSRFLVGRWRDEVVVSHDCSSRKRNSSTRKRALSADLRRGNRARRNEDESLVLVVVVGLVRICIVRLVGAISRQRRTEASVHPFTQVFADLEERKTLLGDMNCLAGTRVPTFIGLVLAHSEATKAADLDAFPAF